MVRVQHLTIILVLLVIGCKSVQQSKTVAYPIIIMEKTICLGTCPSFIFKAYPDGKVTYLGREFTKRIGDFTATITDEELAALRLKFEQAIFFSFANVYSASIKDLPTTFLYYDNGQQNSKITDYYGAPEELKNLESEVEKFIESIDWIKN